MNSGIYIVKIEGFDYHKIGRSNNIKSRLMKYTEIPFNLDYVLKYPLEKSLTSLVEKHLHTVFKKSRVKGEWFTLYEDDIKRVPKIIDEFLKSNHHEFRKRVWKYRDNVRHPPIENPYKVFLDYKEKFKEVKKRTKKNHMTRTTYAHENNISDGQLARILFCGNNNEELFKTFSDKGMSINETYLIIRDVSRGKTD